MVTTERHVGRIILLGYFQDIVSKGSLGILSVRCLASFYRRNCLLGLVPSRKETNITDLYLAKEVLQCNKPVIDRNTAIANEQRCKNRWDALLHSLIIDGVRSSTPFQWPTNMNGSGTELHFVPAEIISVVIWKKDKSNFLRN